MKKWIIIGMSILGTLSSTAYTIDLQSYVTDINIQSDQITAIINKDTSEQELEDLKAFFADNDIELRLKKIEYNANNELTSVSIVLQKGTSKSQYSSSSNTPISEIELGYRDGNLFITSSAIHSNANVWGNLSNFNYPKVDLDSIMKNYGFAFNFNFDQENDSIFSHHFDFKKLKDQLMQSFSFEEDENGNFIFGGSPMNPPRKLQKYNFIDNPKINKLIIVDGQEVDFDTLDKLANADQLDEVDFLKPETAISIYGDKAKDGAIIATTKK